MNAALLIPLLPCLAAMVIGALGSRLREACATIGIAAVTVAAVLSVWVLYLVATTGPFELAVLRPRSPDSLGLVLYVDRLSAVMLVLILLVSAVVHLYAKQYLHGDRGYARFYVLLAVMTAVLVCLVCSGNLLMLFVFWQLLTWLLYLLLVYDYERRPACDAALKTFLVLRFGDLMFLAGVVLAYRSYGTLELHELFARVAESSRTISVAGLDISVATAVALLIFVGAMAKSAQFPLHVWLPDTMDTPTPVSALMHAGIVNAGGFLLNRLAPLYAESPPVLHLVFLVGAATAITGAGIMLTQNDVKKTLGFSTMGQMGYMIMECGLGAFALAVFHLIAHGLFKATLFLGSGSMIHQARREERVPGGVRGHQANGFSHLAWGTGLILTLILPLLIVLLAHNALDIPLLDAHGSVIFLFFSWVTASQVIFSLYRLYVIGSWKIVAAMVSALLVIVVTYLGAGDAFSRFLYPAPGRVEHYFAVAALPGWAFDLLVVVATFLIVAVWFVLYAKVRRETLRDRLRSARMEWADEGAVPEAVTEFQHRLYLWLMNRLYVDLLYQLLASGLRLFAQRLRCGLPEWRLTAGWLVYGLPAAGLLLVGTSSAMSGTTGMVLRTLGGLILLPVLPLHIGIVEGAGRLTGFMSAFTAVFFPVVGFAALVPVAALWPDSVRVLVSILSVISAVYGSTVSLVERHVKRRLLYAFLAPVALVWWFLASGVPADRVLTFFTATVIITGGLLLAWSFVERRVGDQTLDQLSGLTVSMPQLAVLFSLLIMAAVGLPFFGLFFSAMAVMLTSSASAGLLLFVCLVWMAAAWQYMGLLHDLWFGPRRPALITWDLGVGEAGILVALLALELGIGLVPLGHVPVIEAVRWILAKG